MDSLDTLYIMGLMEEYEEAKEWVQNSLDLNSVSKQRWVGITNIPLWVIRSGKTVNFGPSKALVQKTSIDQKLCWNQLFLLTNI